MRLSVVADSDGVAEYQSVKLTPDNWCSVVLCSLESLV